MIGKVLNDRYEIIELIGRGGMAFVYKAKDLKLNRLVAVKVLKEEFSENAQFIRKFERESQSAAGLSHTNIVSVYDVGEDSGIHFIVMELVDGITLKQYLNKKGVLNYDEATSYVVDVAEALSCAHAHGIIHRDIKPQNILMTQELLPKVTDFGIARAVTSSTVTMTKETMGSVHYISPEQARGGFLDERSDLYSLGVMYYELVTGELPFDEDTTVTIAIRHIREPITPPIELNPHIPASVNAVILKLTQKSPNERYQSAEELIEDLDAILCDPNVVIGGAADAEPQSSIAANLDQRGLFQVEQIKRPTSAPTFAPVEDDETDGDDFVLDDIEKAKKKKKIMIGAGIGAGVILLAVLAIVLFFGMKSVEVPDISGMSKSQAEQLLQSVGLKLEVEKEVFSANVEAGKVVTQNPKAKAKAKSGDVIKVTISKGVDQVSVPDVIGKSESDAIKRIEEAKLSWEVQREYNSDYDNGIVYATSPGVGEKADEQSKVIIYVSRGTESATVPGIVGLAENDAIARIQNSGFTVGSVSREYDEHYKEGVVKSQSLQEGSSSDKGAAISYVVSLGPEPVEPPNPESQQQK